MWYLLLKAKTARIFLVRRTGRVKSSSHPQWTASDGIYMQQILLPKRLFDSELPIINSYPVYS